MESLFITLTYLGDIVSSENFWIGIITSLLIIFIIHRIKIPKLTVSGSGHASHMLENGEKLGDYRINISNSPSFMGYAINRETLFVQYARIFDPAKKLYEGPNLHWHPIYNDKTYYREIKAGGNAGIFVCGVYRQRVHQYAGTDVRNIELSETIVELGQSRELEIHVFDNLRRRYTIPFKISATEKRNHMQKVQVQIRTKTTLASRLKQFRIGLSSMLNAFSRSRY